MTNGQLIAFIVIAGVLVYLATNVQPPKIDNSQTLALTLETPGSGEENLGLIRGINKDDCLQWATILMHAQLHTSQKIVEANCLGK